jgi:hypothetical protein
MDLGIAPGLCDGDFWNRVEKTLRRFGSSLNRLCEVHGRREATFQRERDRRRDTWHINWRDLRPPTVHRALGYSEWGASAKRAPKRSVIRASILVRLLK